MKIDCKDFKDGKQTMSNAYCESFFNDTCFFNDQRVFGLIFDAKIENIYVFRLFILILHEMAHRLRFKIGGDQNAFLGSPFLQGINKIGYSSKNKNNAEIGKALEYLLMGVFFLQIFLLYF